MMIGQKDHPAKYEIVLAGVVVATFGNRAKALKALKAYPGSTIRQS